jgi:hypothetical protein
VQASYTGAGFARIAQCRNPGTAAIGVAALPQYSALRSTAGSGPAGAVNPGRRNGAFDPLLTITNVGFHGTNRQYHQRPTCAVYGFGGVLFGTGAVKFLKEALPVSGGNPAKARAWSISICDGMLISGCCRAHR